MSLPGFSVKNSVLVNMLMMVVLIGGGLMGYTLVREMFPEFRPDTISIMSVLPGVQPEEIEKAVTIKIEEAVRDVDGIEKVNSTVNESLSMTRVQLYNEVKNVDAVLQDVKTQVDALQNMPDDLETTITKFEPRLPVISIALYGEGEERDLKRAAQRMRDELLLLPGVSDVEITGIRDDEISVEIKPERLLEYNVTFDQVASAIRQRYRGCKTFGQERPQRNIFPFLDVTGTPIVEKHHTKDMLFGLIDRYGFTHYIGIGSDKCHFQFEIDSF